MAHLFDRSSTSQLAGSPLFQLYGRFSFIDDMQMAYERARTIAKVNRAFHLQDTLTLHDILTQSPKFWSLHMDNIMFLDGAANTLLTIQYNLAGGTLAPFAIKRPELQPLMEKIINFEVSAQFLLTEVSHGLDAMNLETTATLLPDGSFDLHTPNDGAAKYMPPTGPFGGIPRVGIVIARLMVHGEDRGVRPFVVTLGDGKEMCVGVSARLLPPRGGSRPLDHALTYFKHVRLPSTALLGSVRKPKDLRDAFMTSIQRVCVGSLALSGIFVPMMAGATQICAMYSKRRLVTKPDGGMMPIWNFRTQQLPIFQALSQVYVMKAHMLEATKLFTDKTLDMRIRMGIAATVKASMVQQCQASFFALSERCGAHGLFQHNQIITTLLDMRGVAIAEGDVLALSIRLATEILLGRYSLPSPRYPNNLLARHELSLFDGARSIMLSIPSTNHRSETYSNIILPMCQPMVEAIGHRMAYEAAKDAGVPQHLLDMYEISVIKADAGWYAENADIGRWKLREMEDAAAAACLKYFDEDLEVLGMESFVLSPIVTESRWDKFVQGLPLYDGNAKLDTVQEGRKLENHFEFARL